MPNKYAIVWMDSKEARIFRFNAQDVEQTHVAAHSPYRQVHHKAGSIGAGRAVLDISFFDHIIDALRGVAEWLLVGPANAKHEFLKHIERHVPWLKEKLAGIEAMDHPTDGELLAHARGMFKTIDRMHPNSPAPIP